MIESARLYAEQKHGLAKRRGGLVIDHVREVVANLLVMGVQDAPLISAAWLHDIIEDTDADYDDIGKEFGVDVADIVSSLSKDNRLPHDKRVSEYIERLRCAKPGAKVVKLADILTNLESMVDSGMDAAKVNRKVAHLRLYLLVICADIDANLPGLSDVQNRLDGLLRMHGMAPVMVGMR